MSFLALYYELVVIRWLASEVRVFAYFKNLPLLASFLGLGVGCALAGRRPRLAGWFPLLLGLIIGLCAYADPLDIARLRFPDASLYFWDREGRGHLAEAARFLGVTGATFFLVVALFVALGQTLGELMDGLPSLEAYSWNVTGSLVGILAFSAIAFLRWPPAGWLAVGALGAAWFFRRPLGLALLVAGVLVAWRSPAAPYWSPYYRIDFTEHWDRVGDGPQDYLKVGYLLKVNRDFHQNALDLSPAFLAANPAAGRSGTLAGARWLYELPYVMRSSPARVLVVGAGTGNDVAAALRHGARQVDAVEIDPVILDLGRRFHPERPYASGAVRLVNDDARAFLQRAGEPYDLIVFGFLDSHTMFSSVSSLRLDNYVYTVESLRGALRLLAPHGVLSLSFTADGGAWIGHRLLKTLREASGGDPLVVYNGRDLGLTFFAGPGVEKARVAAIPAATEWKPAPTDGAAIRPASDDWPFLYMNPEARPTAYLVVLAMILGGAAALVRVSLRGVDGDLGNRDARPAFHPGMFFLGAPFMLVEVKRIAELSVLFGSTWLVNSAVFSGILVMILGANGIVSRRHHNDVRPWFGLLWASLATAYFVPAAALTGLPFAARATVGALMVSVPILFAGVIFARAFAAVPLPSAALGSNLFGALVGGTLEYLSMLLGIRALSLVALALYVGALLALRGLRQQYKIIKA